MEIKKTSSFSLSIDQESSAEKASTAQSAKTIHTGISAKTKDALEDASRVAQQGGSVDPHALVQHVLRESYLQTTEDLRSYADKVKYFNESKKEIREHLNGLRDADANLKAEFSALQPGQNSNVMEAVAQAIKDSVQENNETRKYFLDVLSSMNKISDYVAEQQKQMSEASTRLAAKEKDDDD